MCSSGVVTLEQPQESSRGDDCGNLCLRQFDLAVWGQHSQECSWSSEVLLDKGRFSSQKSQESKMLCLEARPLWGARDLGREHWHRDRATWGLGDSLASKRKS